ncbi:MAG: hypothetical protein RLZZ435_335 [Cyanobacteriota bacterium]|jgi:DNA-binding YbaB/EbfC family protein
MPLYPIAHRQPIIPLTLTELITMAGKGFGFNLGKMKELTDAFKKAQQVQEGAKQLQEELEEMEVEGQAGGGLVKVYMNGNQRPLRSEISPDVLSEGVEVVSDLITTAMKDAYEKSTSTMRSKMEELTSGLSIPGL